MYLRRGVITFLLLCSYYCVESQYSWDWRDPNDLNLIDLGDNKVALYNTIGIGMSLLISKEKNNADWHHSLSVEYINEYQRLPYSTLYSIKYRRGYQLRKWLDTGVEIGTFLTKNDENVLGFGGCPYFTWHIVNKPRFKISYDNGVGPIVFSAPFPTNGTKFNFYTFYGIEVQMMIKGRSYTLGLRNTHISNAEIKGRERNPAYDGYGVVLRVGIGE